MNRMVYGIMGGIFLLCMLVGAWFLYSEIVTVTAKDAASVQFTVETGETVAQVSARLAAQQVIRSPWLFRQLLAWNDLDTNIKAGEYTVLAPITLRRVVEALSSPETVERTITILPGWDVRDIGNYFEKEGIGTLDQWLARTGRPATKQPGSFALPDTFLFAQKPTDVGLEGYIAPDTYRVYKNASLDGILLKLVEERNSQFTDQMKIDIERSGRSLHEILTLASIIEREVKGAADKAMVADIFWRRLDTGMALQADSTVHYIVGKEGSVFTTAADRQVDSPWNTYKYPGLPPAPISNPSVESITAALYPTKNDYWFFLTTHDGEVKYAKTNDEHNMNRAKYLQ